MKIKILLTSFLIFFTLFSSPVFAVTIPCRFFGTVTVDGNPANASLVTAHLADTGEYLGTATEPLAGFGNYKIDINAVGKYIRFKIAGVWVNEPKQYCSSGNYTYLNLTLSCLDCDNDGYNYTVDCDDSNSSINPGAMELCNAVDDNCDGVIDNFSESCYTGPPETLNKGICKAGTKTCVNGVWSACTDEVTPKSETCNGRDDDCDGSVDEGVCGGGGYVCTPNWVCTEWSACSEEGIQTRTCTDKNNCGITAGKPAETQTCTYVSPTQSTYCGDGICQATETCDICPEDCGSCPSLVVCGNKVCEEGENYNNCCSDCACPEGMECNLTTNSCYTSGKTTGVTGITGFFALLSNPVYALAFGLVIIAILALVLTLIISRRKK
ncbi:MAG: MopE-related protein [Candidatus Aenigmatarchaeota archaeon]